MPVQTVFRQCVEAIRASVLIRRESTNDKEFHFQNWFTERLDATSLLYDQSGRNSYPDFKLVNHTVGFELKALAYPGRDANLDSNSQVPTGTHNGRDVYYVFGRYPKRPDGNAYPVLDLVVCHGDFLNADHDYVHKNRNVKGFGSYGDIMIRDRKMYVMPTPYHLVVGSAHHRTLIVPAGTEVGPGFVRVGELVRRESSELVVGYSFDLRTNDIRPTKVPNPGAGRSHAFTAWRLLGDPTSAVTLSTISADQLVLETEDDDDE